MMRLVFIGPPGAGKGTQAEWLIEHLSIPHLSTGDMLRKAIEDGTEVGKQAESYIAAGDLVPDEVVIQIVAERLAEDDCQAGFLLDGFPRTLAQAQAADAILHERGISLQRVLALDVPDDVLEQRLLGRGRQDDTPEVIRQRFEVYRRQTAPLLDYFQQQGLLHSIDGTGTPQEVTERIRQLIEQWRASRD